jgi:hypothetical protein
VRPRRPEQEPSPADRSAVRGGIEERGVGGAAHSAVTRTPVPRLSPHSASVNDSTYALVAPSRRGFEQRLQHLTDILEALISQ